MENNSFLIVFSIGFTVGFLVGIFSVLGVMV